MQLRKILTGLLVLVACGASYAQSIDTAQLVQEVNTIQAPYRGQTLSFDVRYTYASDLKPAVVLDSLGGSVVMEGASCYYKLDNTETFSNSHFNIVLFKEDKVMYLSRPAEKGADPLAQFRMLLSKSGVMNASVTKEGKFKVLFIRFRPESPCVEMQIVVEKQTGFIASIRYKVKTALMMGAQQADAAPDPAYGEYALVHVTFDHYKTLPPDSARWDEQSYFHRDGKQFVPAPAYSDYKIFEGSPNL